MRLVPWTLALVLSLGSAHAADTLDLYFIDTDGGQATLIVAPSGASLLIDAGNEGYGGRDAQRIRAAAREAGVKRIDYLLTTHFHPDHSGGIPNLLTVLPPAMFLDGGGEYPESYRAAFAQAKHQVVTPGDSIPMKGLTVTVAAAGGRTIAAEGRPNPHCEGLASRPADAPEHAQSAALVVEFGKFRFATFGDLDWNGELALLCPANRAGQIDVFLATRHGAESPKAVHGMAPRVAIINNAARSGADPAGWKNLAAAPGIEDIWQVHFAMANGGEANAPDAQIANLGGTSEGNHLKVSASPDGSFTVLNPRNKFTRRYAAR